MSVNDKYLSKTTIIGQSCRELFLPLMGKAAAPLVQAGVRLAGFSELKQPYIMDRKSQNFHLLLYTVSGKAKLWIGGEEYDFAEKNLWVVPAGPDVHYELHEASWVICWFHLGRCKEWAHLEGRQAQVIDAEDNEKLPVLMQGFASEYHLAQAGRVDAVRMYAEILALYVRRALPRGGVSENNRLRQRIERLWTHVEEAPSFEWSAEELAGRCYISPTHLFRLCQQYFGCAPMRKVRQIRIHRARLLLQQTDYPLEAIASMVGYANVYSFSKAFTAEEGRSPGALRRNG